MRIISKFKDYYDCIQAMGQDKSVVYLRNEFDVKRFHSPGVFAPICRYGDVNAHAVTIGFCGKVYPLIEVRVTDESNPRRPTTKVAFCYNTEAVDNFLQENISPERFEIYLDSSRFPYYKFWVYGFKRRDVQKYFHEAEREQNLYENVFIENKAPIFVSDRKWKSLKYSGHPGTIFNTSLKEYEFYRVFDPYMAFQELSMYVGGVLAMPNKKIPEISDEVMAEAKGFDKKTSFRKAPGGKKRKNKA